MSVQPKAYIDWDADGSFATSGDDISSYIQHATWRRGIWGRNDRMAYTGTCTLVVTNADRRFSPRYSSSPYYGKFKPGREIKLQATDGVSTWDVFRGIVTSFKPTVGKYGVRTTIIEAEDLIGKLRRGRVSLPIVQDKRGDEIITLVSSNVFRGDAATGTITFSANPSADDTVTVGSTTYTFKASVGATANQVLIGTAKEDTAKNLTAAINTALANISTGYEYDAVYGSSTVKNASASASLSGAIVTVTALYRGTLGNAIPLAKSGANIAVSGAALSSGTDEPDGLTDYDAGVLVFDEAGDSWDTETTGYDAIKDVIQSTGTGYFFVKGDGTLAFRNNNWIFDQQTVTPSITIDNHQKYADGRQSIDDIYNEITVRWNPRTTLSSGVIARASTVISVPGTGGGAYSVVDRWNPTEDKATADNTQFVNLGYIDLDTGTICGAETLSTPLTPFTDFEVNEASDGSMVDYTEDGSLTLSLAATSSGVEVTMQNAAQGTLYVTKLEVRGEAIVQYDPVTTVSEDTDSIDTYGRLPMVIPLPLTCSTISVLAPLLADYELSQRKDADYLETQLRFEGITEIGGVNVFSLDIGDVAIQSEYQTAISSQRCVILGVYGDIDVHGKTVLSLAKKDIDNVGYWKLDDTTYSVLGTTTRLAL